MSLLRGGFTGAGVDAVLYSGLVTLTAAEWGSVGEIDCIAVDEAHKTVWVGEAKDLFIPFSPATVRRSYEKYFDTDAGYVAKLLKKSGMILQNLPNVLKSFGIADGYDQWRVVPLMITRRVEPAGFARANSVEFCAVASVVDVVNRWYGDHK